MKIILLVITIIFCSKAYCQSENVKDTLLIKEYINAIAKDSFDVSNSCSKIPRFLRKFLSQKNTFEITANKNRYDATDAVMHAHPIFRLLKYVAKSSSFIILTYDKRGYGSSTHTIIIKYHDKKVDSICNIWLSPHNSLYDFILMSGLPSFKINVSNNY